MEVLIDLALPNPNHSKPRENVIRTKKRKFVSEEDVDTSDHEFETSSDEEEVQMSSRPKNRRVPLQSSSNDLFGEGDENLSQALGENLSLEITMPSPERVLETYLITDEDNINRSQDIPSSPGITPTIIDLTTDDSSDILRFLVAKMLQKSKTDTSFKKGFEASIFLP